MPQMSPLMWMTLFMSFSSMLMVMITKTYFLNTPKNVKSNTNQTLSKNIYNSHWMW